MDENKKTGRGSGLPVLTKEMQGENINALNHRAINLIHFTKKWRAAAENTN